MYSDGIHLTVGLNLRLFAFEDVDLRLAHVLYHEFRGKNPREQVVKPFHLGQKLNVLPVSGNVILAVGGNNYESCLIYDLQEDAQPIY